MRESISIGIPSYNEGRNILRLLRQINREKEEYNLNILEVIISDDSNDDTPMILENHIDTHEYPFKIRLLHHTSRRGVAAAWNEIFREAMGDVVVLYDADIILGRGALKNLVEKLLSNEEYGIVGGRTEAIYLRGLAAEASYMVSKWLHEMRIRYPDSQFTIMGRILAVRRDIVENLHIPRHVIAVDLYLQCHTCKMGYRVGYAEDAEIYFKPPQRISEMMSQILRAVIGHHQISSLVNKYIRRRVGLGEQIRVFFSLSRGSRLRNMFSTVVAYGLGAAYIPLVFKGSVRHIWDIATSTKTR